MRPFGPHRSLATAHTADRRYRGLFRSGLLAVGDVRIWMIERRSSIAIADPLTAHA
jgi:hypothetical protein